LENLGKQHVAYRVEKKHYYTVGLALLVTLETCLGDDFTPEIKDAWLLLTLRCLVYDRRSMLKNYVILMNLLKYK
jgi:hypothetical protein